MKIKSVLLRIVEILSIVLLLILFSIWIGVTAFVTNVPTGSMLPTIQLNTKYLVVKDYLVQHYYRGDIVVFHQEDDSDTALVKRIIGLPGDIVDIRNGSIFINGDALEESYLGSNDINFSKTFYVPEDCYFFLGDNRVDSKDARYWEQPYIHKDFLVGRVVLEIYPRFHRMLNPFTNDWKVIF